MRSRRYAPSEATFTVTRAAGVALGGGVLILAGLAFAAAPLFVPGAAFTAIGLLAPLWIWLSARGATVERVLEADRVLEDQPVEAKLEVSCGWLGIPRGEVIDPLADSSVPLRGALRHTGGRARAVVRVVATFSRRGAKRLEAPSLIVTDPLDLARVQRLGRTPAHELLVLPRVEPIRWAVVDLEAQADQLSGRAMSEPLAAAELDGLRPYRVGTSASRIHWPALARGAGLLERRLSAERDTRPLIALDARCASPEYLDAAVRATASLALHFARLGGCSVLLPGDRRPIEIDPDLRRWPGAHARLAVVEGDSRSRPPALSRGMRRGRIFYIAATAMQRLPVAVARAGHHAAVLVLPKGLDQRVTVPASFEVSGCRGYLMVVTARAETSEAV